jgi:hypothetical protein
MRFGWSSRSTLRSGLMQMSVLKAAVLGATIVGLVACSQQTPGPYTKFEGMPPDATVTMDEVQAAWTYR